MSYCLLTWILEIDVIDILHNNNLVILQLMALIKKMIKILWQPVEHFHPIYWWWLIDEMIALRLIEGEILFANDQLGDD